jgi:hypothetical protein
MIGRMLLREYQPYDRASLSIQRRSDIAPNDIERQRMDDRVGEVLDGFSVEEYFGERFTEAMGAIERVHRNAGETLSGHVVEFAAGTCKLGGFLSKLDTVERVTCIDFSDGLLTEIAPRVVSHIGGDMSKITFLVADMNRLPEFDLGPIDWLVGYYAVHHLAEPRQFFASMRGKVAGGILAYREPALPMVPIPTSSMRAFLRAQAQKRSEGEYERNFSLFSYRRAAAGYSFRTVPVYRPVDTSARTRALELVSTVVWPYQLDVAYVLKPS